MIVISAFLFVASGTFLQPFHRVVTIV